MSDLKDMFRQEVKAHFDQIRWCQNGGAGCFYPGVDDASGGSNTSTDAPRTEGVDYSGTNNQEQGVDEPDFVKTDGYHIYTINGNQLFIFGTPNFGDLVPESASNLEGWPQAMLLDKTTHKLTVTSYIDPSSLPDDHPLKQAVGSKDVDGNWLFRVWEITKLTVFDVSDTTAPKLVRELYVEGYYGDGRMVDQTVRLTTFTWLNIPGVNYWWWWDGANDLDSQEQHALDAVDQLALTDVIPRIYERLPDRTFTTYPLTEDTCANFYRPSDAHGYGVTSIITMDMSSDDFKFQSDDVITNWSNLYSSADKLYIVTDTNDWWWFWFYPDWTEQTDIHAFDISQPGQTTYVGSGRVNGRGLDQFSFSEYDGALRVATVEDFWGRWWYTGHEEAPVNHLYVLDVDGSSTSSAASHGERAGQENGLPIIGELDGFAAGESLWATRFDGDKGYAVSYQWIDPLITFDLSDKYNPTIAGQLQVPGVSEYLQTIPDGRLLSIGEGGNADGTINWQTAVGLYDVSDLAAPKLLSQQTIVPDQSYSWSEAQYDHHAFQYWDPKKLLAIPVSSWKEWQDPTGNWYYSYLSQLQVLKVGNTLSSYGTIDHSRFYNSSPDTYWYYTDIRRSIFMGDFIYAISDRGITANRDSDLAEVAAQPLPGYSPYDYWWWW